MSKSQELPNILERVQRCRHCGREVTNGSLSFLENPFCDVCLKERVGLDQSILGEIRWRVVGHYMELIPTTPQRPS
jgi:hypothetical protein